MFLCINLLYFIVVYFEGINIDLDGFVVFEGF